MPNIAGFRTASYAKFQNQRTKAPNIAFKAIPESFVKEVVNRVEKEIKDLPYEVVVIINSKTGEILKIKGDVEHVELDKNALTKLKGNILTHNHPEGGIQGFSEQDIRTAIAHGVAEIRVVCDNKVHSVTIPENYSVNDIPQDIIRRIRDIKLKDQKFKSIRKLINRNPSINLKDLIEVYTNQDMENQFQDIENQLKKENINYKELLKEELHLNFLKICGKATEHFCKKIGLSYKCEDLI